EVEEDRNVAGRIDVRRRRAELGVGDDALVELDGRSVRRLSVVVEPDAVGEQVELHVLAVDGVSLEATVQPAELLHLIRRDDLHTLRLTHLAAQLPAFLVKHVAEEPWTT